eukprot:TRINITY_DN5017_c0_g1_i4.p1 TRINITY_DN5017_c0_g1~~TRINITY_DN5017_c0_g1_i4.p1  ORF type:complete len:112 (-),score=2.65 TRINITY_DN5017_c0_g1_i4:12-347(-)
MRLDSKMKSDFTLSPELVNIFTCPIFHTSFFPWRILWIRAMQNGISVDAVESAHIFDLYAHNSCCECQRCKWSKWFNDCDFLCGTSSFWSMDKLCEMERFTLDQVESLSIF